MSGKITEPGVYTLTLDQYHGDPCDGPSISNSGLQMIAECPAKYWWHSPLNPKRPEVKSRALSFGNAAHKWLLQGDDFWSEFAVLPEDHNGRTNEGKARVAEIAESGKTVLRHDEFEVIQTMRDALLVNEIAAASFTNGACEQSLVWRDQETGVWLRCRPDFLPTARTHIPDYKTARSANPEGFRRDVWTYGYHCQAALYHEGIRAIFGEEPQSFYFIVQEKEPPYVVTPIALTEVALRWGRLQNRRAIRLFADCLERGHWPGYVEDVATIGLPVWAERELEHQHERGLLDLYHAPLAAE